MQINNEINGYCDFSGFGFILFLVDFIVKN